MNQLLFLYVITSGLLICRIAWVIYEYDPDEFPRMCECYCFDATMSTPDMVSRIEYKGNRKNGTCSCQDFLVPRIRQYIFSASEDDTCQICHCKAVEESDCKDGLVSFSTIFTVVTYTVGVMTLLLTIVYCVRLCSASKSKKSSRSRRGYYQTIGGRNDHVIKIKENMRNVVISEPEKHQDFHLLDKEENLKLYQTFQI